VTLKAASTEKTTETHTTEELQTKTKTKIKITTLTPTICIWISDQSTKLLTPSTTIKVQV